MKRIFFDNAATTPLDERVITAMTEAMRNYPGNPSSIHNEGRTARAAIEQARKQVAQVFNASIGEIFFTSCGTESNNMALKCSVRDLGVRRIISTRTEHHAVLHTLHTLKEFQQTEIVYLDQRPDGHVDLEQLAALLQESDKKTLVSLMHANNEVGTLLNLQQVSGICAEQGALLHSDTVQTVGYYPIDVSELKLSFITGSAHKFHGPKGTGFIYINGDNLIRPFIDGGAQERNMRGGTENTYGIIGLATALQLADQEREERKKAITEIRTYFQEQLTAHFTDLEFNGDPFGEGHYKLLSVSFPDSPRAELILLNLDIAGISVSGGSACSSGADAGSHVMDALRPGSLRKTVRFSFSHKNTREEVDAVITELKKIVG